MIEFGNVWSVHILIKRKRDLFVGCDDRHSAFHSIAMIDGTVEPVQYTIYFIRQFQSLGAVAY